MKKTAITLGAFFIIGVLAAGLSAYLPPHSETQSLMAGLFGFAFFASLYPLHKPTPTPMVLVLLCLAIGFVAYLSIYWLYWLGPLGHGIGNIMIAGLLVNLYFRKAYRYFLAAAFALGLISYFPVLFATAKLDFPSQFLTMDREALKWAKLIFWWGFINGPLLSYLFYKSTNADEENAPPGDS